MGEYIGLSEQKTARKLNEAKGGVLFVDEAYRLTPSDCPKDFGKNAVNELMSVMESGNPVMIFAGYPKEMKSFLSSNPGLSSRIRYKFKFPDYTTFELSTILLKIADNRGFKLVTDDLPTIISENTTARMRSQQNARLARNIFEGSVVCQSGRLAINADDNDLFEITEGDLKQACFSLRGIDDGEEDNESCDNENSG